MSESFEGARVFAEVMYPDCSMSMLDRLQKAHEHEIEHLRKARFHEGYVAGQRSMDAEHRAVAMRLRALPLDEDSHGNLSQIARAIWHSDFGWTRGACEALRDELIRLLGGVHDALGGVYDGDDGGEDFRRCGACGDCDCGGDEQPQVVTYDQSHESSPMGQESETGITDELRKRIADVCKVSGLSGEKLYGIADRIDERHEAALQSAIESTMDYDDLYAAAASFAGCDECGEYKQCMYQEFEKRVAVEQERDDLQKKLDSMAQEYIAMRSALEISNSAMKDVIVERDNLKHELERSRAEYCETCEEAETTDILRAKLGAVREALDG